MEIQTIVSAAMPLLVDGRLNDERVGKMRVFGFFIHSLLGCRLEDVCVDACRFERAFRACFASVYARNSPECITKAAAEGVGFVGRVVGVVVMWYLVRFIGLVLLLLVAYQSGSVTVFSSHKS